MISDIQLAQFHMSNWTQETSDPGSIKAMIGLAKKELQELAGIADCYQGKVIPVYIQSEREFWNNYIRWGQPIVAHWWGT